MSGAEGGSQDQAVRCPKCGTNNPRDAAQCLYCGERLGVAGRAPVEGRRLPLMLRLVASLVVAGLVFAISCESAYHQFRDSHVVAYPSTETLRRIAALRDAVEAYRSKRGSPPTSLRNMPAAEGRGVQIDEGGMPLDRWQRQFHYTTYGTGYEIASYGQDGKPGGVGLDADLSTGDLAEYEALVQRNRLPLVKRARPTFEQFVRDKGEFGNAGSGYMMFVTSIVTAGVALLLGFVSLSGRIAAGRGAWAVIRRFLVTVAGTVLIALIYIIPFHAPTGH